MRSLDNEIAGIKLERLPEGSARHRVLHSAHYLAMRRCGRTVVMPGVRSVVVREGRRRAALRRDLDGIRAHQPDRDHQPPIRILDRSARIRAAHRSDARPADASVPHHRNPGESYRLHDAKARNRRSKQDDAPNPEPPARAGRQGCGQLSGGQVTPQPTALSFSTGARWQIRPAFTWWESASCLSSAWLSRCTRSTWLPNVAS